MSFHLRSSAKVNLTLDILNRRADGYHELASVVHTVGLWDEMECSLGPGDRTDFSCDREELCNDDNLCVRAFKLWREAVDEAQGATIYLKKKIPTGAGLGGGSGNAAAILMGFNSRHSRPLSTVKLHRIAAKLGADVPLFLSGGAVLMEGIGEKLSPLEAIEGWLLIIKPSISLSTPGVYRVWDENGLESEKATGRMLEIWPPRPLKRLAAHLGNDLERAAAPISTAPAQCVRWLREAGALGAQMSGSGSASFGIFETREAAEAAAEAIKCELAKDVQVGDSQLFVAPFCNRGVEFKL